MTSNDTINIPCPLPLTDAETKVLQLFDKVQELQLQLALLKSYQTRQGGPSHEPVRARDRGSRDGRIRLLEANAAFSLRNSVIETVVITHPMLNAVHHATYSSPLERDLLPYTQQRDAIAMETALSCSNLEEAKRQLADLETNVLRTSHNNMMLASELLKVASKGQLHNPSRKIERANVEITKLEEEVKSSYYRWKIMKGAAVAVVAGSGVDWVRNEHLRNVVLDIQD